MLFKSKKKLPTLPSLILYDGDCLLYDGLLKDVPLKESVILEKSEAFFNDPEPCYIHRTATSTRLTAEIEREFDSSLPDNAPGPLLVAYVDFDHVTHCELKRG